MQKSYYYPKRQINTQLEKCTDTISFKNYHLATRSFLIALTNGTN